jgi:type I restriction-modification system DNA methylase subunit
MSPLERLHRLYEEMQSNEEFASNEAQVSKSLVAPFFRDVLGWNIEHPDEFKYEHQVGGKRADILACIDGISRFVIEVKSMTHVLRDNLEFYKQAIQYADGKGKRYAILTNFREFVILRTDVQPKDGNWLTLAVASYAIDQLKKDLCLMKYFRREAWADNIEELEALDRAFTASYDRRKPVDERLLELFVAWRSTCLTWLKKNKSELFERYAQEYVEEEVQRYLDRLIFTTSCEDKGIEDVQLRQFIPLYRNSLRIEGHHVTRGIRRIFEKYYSRYDSDLFDRGLADRFEFDDAVTYGILRDIKSPNKELPFDFSTISPDILGKTYENFIGHLTRGRTKLEEVQDFQVRKQEGIYYTPQWIVDQIVSRTVREYIRDKTVDDLFEVKILDPACGSGAFLVAAYQALISQAESVAGRALDYNARKDLFLSCIHGVDKDERACDIAKLNVSLQMAVSKRKLPSLSKNIQCGDSLMLHELEGYSKAMEWRKRFPAVFSRKGPGFDIILGNPPYLSTKDFDESTKYENVLRSEFGQLKDLYYLFVRLNDMLIRPHGVWAFILPNTFFTLTNYRDFRDLLRTRYDASAIDLSPNVFKEAYVFNAILVAKRVPEPANGIEMGYLQRESTGQIETRELYFDQIKRFPKMPFFFPSDVYLRYDKRILEKAGVLWSAFENELLNVKAFRKGKNKLGAHVSALNPGDLTLLGLISEGSQGLVTGNNSRYLGIIPDDERHQTEIWRRLNRILAERTKGHEPLKYTRKNAETLYEKADDLKDRLKDPVVFGKKFLYKIVEAEMVRDFSELDDTEKEEGIEGTRCWIPYFRGNDEGEIWKVNTRECICWSRQYVRELKEQIVTNSRWQGEEYFFKSGFGWVDYFDERIKGFYVEPTVYSKNVVKFHSWSLPDEYILGLLNSSYVSHYVKHYITNTRTLQVNDGKLIPIAFPDKDSMHEVVRRVQEIISLKGLIYDSKDENERHRLDEKIRRKESELDDRVFEVYGFDLVRDQAAIQSIRTGLKHTSD